MFVIPDGPSGPIRNPEACGEEVAPGFRVSLSLARNDFHPESRDAVTLVLRSKDQGPGASAQKVWILGSAARPQDDGGVSHLRGGRSPNPESMDSGSALKGVPEIGGVRHAG